MMDINLLSARAILFFAVIGLFTHSASAKWTVTTEGAPSGCNHVISDGNWKIGVYRNSDGERMFRYCSALKTVTFNNGIESIGNYGFSGCSSLEWDEITFPASLKTLGDHAFEDCTKIIGTVTFPGVTNVTGSYHFEDCTAMTNFVAPRLVTTARVMFNRCTALKSASFSPDLETIVAQSFEKGDSQKTPQLESFFPTNMPKLKTFGEKAFRGQKLLVGNFDFSLSAITELPYYACVDD